MVAIFLSVHVLFFLVLFFEDINGPSFNGTCPSNMVVVAGSGEETAVARWQTPTVHDEAGHVVNVTSTLESGSVLGEGVHSVIIHAFDDSGNRMSCFFVIEVRGERSSKSMNPLMFDIAPKLCIHDSYMRLFCVIISHFK